MADHYPKRYATSVRVNGKRQTVYVLTCPCFKKKDPTHKGNMMYSSRAQQDQEFEKHKS